MTEILTSPIFIAILILLLAPIPAAPFVGSYIAFTQTLKRGKKEKWGHELPKDLPEQSRQMYAIGAAWSEKNRQYKTEVHTKNGEINLFGEYYDLGKEVTVMILSGRTESLSYGYYFAIPYSEWGCNVLVVDPRAHGKSDGVYNTAGFEESGDAIAWVEYLKENFGVKKVVFHGICIGSAAGLFALVSERCPDVLLGLVAEGMFANFGESVKNHLIEQKRGTAINYPLINMWMKRFTGYSMDDGPIDRIAELKHPLLMLHSREDIYSTPEFAQKLYDLAGSENKRLVWFEKGKHSMLRITDTELYDRSINEFLDEITNKEKI